MDLSVLVADSFPGKKKFSIYVIDAKPFSLYLGEPLPQLSRLLIQIYFPICPK